ADKLSIGDDGVLERHRRLEVPRHLVVREVVRGEPEVIELVFPLAPDLSRHMRPLGDECEPTTVVDLSIVLYGEADGVSECGRMREKDDERVTAAYMAQWNTALARDSFHA